MSEIVLDFAVENNFEVINIFYKKRGEHLLTFKTNNNMVTILWLRGKI